MTESKHRANDSVAIAVVAACLVFSACGGAGESFGTPCQSDEDCPAGTECVRVENQLVCGEPYDDDPGADGSADVESGDAAADAGGDQDGADTGEADTLGADTVADDATEVGGDISEGDGGTEPIPTHDQIGGGEPYVEARKRAGESTFCERPEGAIGVSDRSEFVDALGSASPGDVVYLTSDAAIELGAQRTVRVPDGVTIASNRGCDGAEGGRLYVERDNTDVWKVLATGAEVRFSGIQMDGPREEFDPNIHSNGEPISIGISVEGDDFEFDNNDIQGFSHAAVFLDEGEVAHVHHNHIHHNPMDGLGYGVAVANSGDADDVLIEHNEMNHNRHSIANNNPDESGYEARYNHFGPEAISYVMGTHAPGGTTIEIHHNTVEAVEHLVKKAEAGGDIGPNITIRGVPSDVAHIHHNWLYNPQPPADSPHGWSNEAITQPVDSNKNRIDSWTNVDFHDNHYGDTDPEDCSIGAPRPGCAP